MQVSVESGEGLEKRLLVELPAERVDLEVDKKLKRLSRTARMDGFRPGKVPMRVLKQRYGEQVRYETYDEVIKSTFYEAVNQAKLKPAGEPRIELGDEDTDGKFRYTAIFETVPEVELADLTDVTVKQPVAEVTDDDVEAMITKLRRQRMEWNEVDRAAQDGDTVHMDFKGFIDGEAFDGGSAENVPLELGSGNMIEGFESGLLGAKAGDERTLELKFPEDYRAEHLAGKDATFEIKLNKVSEPQLPALDEDFIKSMGVEEGTEEAMRTEIRGNMQRELKQKLRSLTKERVMDALLKVNEFDIPNAMIQDESQRLKQQAQAEMQQAGQKSALDLPLSIFENQAKRRVALGILVGDIVNSEKIKIDRDRVNATIGEFAETYEDPQEVIDWYKNDKQQLAAVENLVLEEQVVDWVLSKLKVEDEAVSFDDIMGPAQG